MIYQIVFELSILLIFLGGIFHAYQRELVSMVLVGFIYGLSLEILTIISTERYEYGEFLLMIDDVPLSVAMAWSMIIYTAYLIISDLSLNITGKATLAGLYALHLDLLMDVIAIRLFFWDWGNLIDDYFGVPYGNFLAWFLIVTTYIGSFLLIQEKTNLTTNKISVISFLISLPIVLVNNLIMLFLRQNIEPVFFIYIGLYLIPIAITLQYYYQLESINNTRQLLNILLISFFHSFFTVAYIMKQMYLDIPIVIPIHLMILIASYYGFIQGTENKRTYHQATITLAIIYLIIFVLANII